MIPTIYGVYPQESYGAKIDGVVREDHQDYFVDFGGIVDKGQAVTAMLSDNRIPIPFQQHPTIAGLYANPISYEQNKEVPNVWIVKVTWKTITDITQTIKDPTERPALIATGTYKQQVVLNYDFNGKPVVTAAGEPINYQKQRSYPTFTVMKKLKKYPTTFATLRDMVNTDIVTLYGTDFPPFSLFCPDVAIGFLSYEGNYPFYPFEATLYVNMEETRLGFIGWRTLLRNAGFHEKRLAGYQRDKNGNYVKSKPIYSYDTIVLGQPGNYSYPASPVLLNPLGRAFRKQLPDDVKNAKLQKAKQADIDAGYYNTGEVIGAFVPGDPATQGITQKQWDQAVVEITADNLVAFNDIFPLR